MYAEGESRRHRSHTPADEGVTEPEANLLQWTMAFGLLIGTLAGIAGWAVSDEGALTLGIVGFVMGGLGGFLAALLTRYTPNSLLSDAEAHERLSHPDWPFWYHPNKFNTGRISYLEDKYD